MPNAAFPTTDVDFDPWFHNFVMKFAIYAVTLGYTAADATALANEYEWFHWAFTQQQVFEAEVAERIAFKRSLRDGPIGAANMPLPTVDDMAPPTGAMPAPGILPRLRKLIQAIKNHKNYTATIGNDLDIIAAASTDTGTPKPIATGIAMMNSQVQLTFKKGTHEAVRIEGQRGAEAAFSFLANVLHSPWNDLRAPLVAGQPEIRKYRLCYCDGDEMVGEYSDIITVVTNP